MNNASFVSIDDKTRAQNLVDILEKRCHGFIKRDVLTAIVNRLDPKKQMVIDTVNESTFKIQAKVKSTITIQAGEIESVNLQWCRCIFGAVDFGREVITIDDGSEDVKTMSECKIVSHPAIVLIEEQTLGNIDCDSSRLIIYI